MEIKFSFEELEIQKAVRRFARNDLLPIAREVDEKGALPDPLMERFISMGLLKSSFPVDYGGAGGSFTGFILALKEISYASLVPSWMLFENFMLAFPLLEYGSEYLKTTYLHKLLSSASTGALAFTEPDTGSDPEQLRTIAKKVEGGWIINGGKRFITHSGTCDQMILFARTGNEVTAFLVESKNQGYRVGKRESFIQAFFIDNGELYLEDYFAQDKHVIGQVGQGFEVLLKTEALGKIGFSALFVGLAERAIDLAINYASTRMHRDKPIGEKFQMTQVKLARMMSKVELMNAYLFQTSSKVDRREDIFVDAAVLKLIVGDQVKEITADAMEIHGAYGLSQEYPIGYLYRTAIGAQAIMGSLDIQRVIIAKSLLGKGHYRWG